ncbi:hypothetical protein MW887_010632 [Aspergillus wentii]|nr:hypothetical protein MW887_010632 [Aspergillus wentii]
MVYYIRFLKTPRIQKQKAASLTISALICITTDLGDSFLAEDVELFATLSVNQTEKILYQEKLKWTAGKRELPISLGPFPAQLSQHTVVLGVSASDPRQPHSSSIDHLLGKKGVQVPLVISGWSAPFGGSEALVAEKLVERRFGPKDRLDLKIWEETGNSIARHIWDAALASVMYIQQAIQSGPDTAGPLQGLLQNQRSSPLHVIELGSGCGIVGIALAQLLSRCSVLLTDLPEVEEIVRQNIAATSPTRSSEIEYQTLDWDEKVPEDLFPDGPIDLILISDCTYNADSLPALVSVLDQLMHMSPDAIVLVALKRRHDSETIFFDLMQTAGFRNLHQDSMKLPSQHAQVDRIELYCYGRHPSTRPTVA